MIVRKADYTLLARLICDERHTARLHPACDTIRDSLAYVAREFAQGASVNKQEFLRACGMDTLQEVKRNPAR